MQETLQREMLLELEFLGFLHLSLHHPTIQVQIAQQLHTMLALCQIVRICSLSQQVFPSSISNKTFSNLKR